MVQTLQYVSTIAVIFERSFVINILIMYTENDIHILITTSYIIIRLIVHAYIY